MNGVHFVNIVLLSRKDNTEKIQRWESQSEKSATGRK